MPPSKESGALWSVLKRHAACQPLYVPSGTTMSSAIGKGSSSPSLTHSNAGLKNAPLGNSTCESTW